MTGFRPGDVVNYIPSDFGRADRWWCREGVAIAEERGDRLVFVDTYWGSGNENHVLRDDEIATAQLRFHLADFDELDRYGKGTGAQWRRYAEGDREYIPSQHSLQRRYFIRKGATEDLPTQVANKREEIAKAEAERDYYARKVEWLNRELAELEAQAAVTR